MARLREDGRGPDVHFVRHAALDEPQLKRKQALQEIEDDDPGDGWVGDSAEREWAQAMAHFASGKVVVAGKPGYESFDETWLLIYDNWPVPNNDPRTSASYLLEQPSMSAILERFSRLFIMDGARVWEFSGGAAAFHVLRRVRTSAVDRAKPRGKRGE